MSLFTFLCYFAIDTNCLHLRSSNTAKIDLKGKKNKNHTTYNMWGLP